MQQTLLRYDENRTNNSWESDTRQRVKELRMSNMFMSMSAIARLIGISRQRVFQI
jgi:hypothetical protein